MKNMNFSVYTASVMKLQKRFGDAPEICIQTGTSGPRFSMNNKPISFHKFLALPFNETYIHMAEGHIGTIDVIEIAGKRVCVIQGRLHYYQGYTIEQVVFLSRVMALWGCKQFIFTNASGALKPLCKVSRIINLTNHILDPGIPSPMIGVHQKELGKMFTSMNKPYGLSSLIADVMISTQNNPTVRNKVMISGTYLATSGPSFESEAEAKKFARDADIVGMSTVPEVIALRSMGIIGIGVLSLVTNNTPAVISKTLVTHTENTHVSKEAEPCLLFLLTEIIKSAKVSSLI